MAKKILKSLREYKKPTIWTLVFIIAEAVIETFIPFLTADLVNDINAGTDVSELLKTGALLFVMAILSLASGAAAGFLCSKASSGLAKNLRSDMFARIQSFSFENVDKFSSASLVTRMTTDVNNVQMAYMMIIRMAIRAPLMFLFSVIMAYYMGGAMATSFVVVIPIMIFGLVFIAKKAMPAFRRVFKKYDKLNESVEENVRGIRVVKGFVREDYEKEKFNTAAEDICKDFTKAERIVAMNSPIMQFCLYFNMVAILALGSYIVVTTKGLDVNVGQISAMLTYGVQILMSLMIVSILYVMLTMSAESVRRIGEVLNEEPALRNPDNPIMTVKDGSVDFENVSFKYSSTAQKNALENVNLHIESGMTVGIIGGTGSSKSTLVQLIPRLYDVTDGTVKVGGTDVREYDLETLRDAVSMVLQKNVLFAGTIEENLRWGNENATDEEIMEVCKLAQAHGFIDTIPNKYIEQGGANVSGGQKQRLCIARALLKKPKILILDDSTSAVDTKTDAMIRAGLKKYIPETTKIIIAQRIASVQDADMIIVMDNGRIENVGKHDELLKSSQIYREVYEQQTRGGDSHEE